MANYVARIADHELDARLRVMGAVLIEGPKACGKTATASQIANTIIRLDEDPVARAQLDFDPQALFSGRPPILFDEWQVEPEIWNRVRRQVDDREEKGQFILTGSARPRDNANRHSGAGRFSVMQMRPMSLFETGHSTGEISLANLLAGERQAGLGTHLSFDNLIRRIITGGWPDLLDSDEDFARDWLADYLRQVIEVDVPEMGHRRNPGNLRRLLESLARGVGQPVKLSDLAKDVGGEGGPVAHETITGYLDALRRLWLTDDSAAWRPHMRSRTRLRTAPVRYFVDPSIGTAALSIGSAEPQAGPSRAGLPFRSAGHPRPPNLRTVAPWAGRLMAGRKRQRSRCGPDRPRQHVGSLRHQAQPTRCRRRGSIRPQIRRERRHRPTQAAGLPGCHHLDGRRWPPSRRCPRHPDRRARP